MSPRTVLHPAFSLHALVQAVRAETAITDPHALAKEITARIRPRDREAALVAALGEYCRQDNTRQRPGIRRPVAPARSSRSAKVTAIRQSWPQLRATIATAAGQKPVGDCTAADLIFQADLLAGQAARCAGKAAAYRQLAAAMTARRARTVAGLPDDILAGFFGTGQDAA